MRVHIDVVMRVHIVVQPFTARKPQCFLLRSSLVSRCFTT